jgi:very-short-patch-repair endonuclease
MTQYYNRESEKSRRRAFRSSMPDAEVILWSRLQRRQLLGCKFRRQYSVGSYMLDFFSPEIKLAIELDGDSHFRAGAPEHDEKRRQFIESFGIGIIRFLNTEIRENLDGVLERIGREVLEPGQRTLCPTGERDRGGCLLADYLLVITIRKQGGCLLADYLLVITIRKQDGCLLADYLLVITIRKQGGCLLADSW